MKLVYRGIEYTANKETFTVVESDTKLNFHGSSYRMPATNQAIAEFISQGLKFRGAAY